MQARKTLFQPISRHPKNNTTGLPTDGRTCRWSDLGGGRREKKAKKEKDKETYGGKEGKEEGKKRKPKSKKGNKLQ